MDANRIRLGHRCVERMSGKDQFQTAGTMRGHWLVALFAAAMLLFTATGKAQIAGTASIQGTVTDPSGAVIPNAPVTVVDAATQVKHTTLSGQNGLYSFPNINIGTYNLTVTAPGFKTYSQHNIVLEVGSSIGINVTMPVGEASQQVEVQADGIALQTEDSSFKQTVDQKTLTELPLNGRQVTSLIGLSGASVPGNALTQGNKGFFSSVSPNIAGGQGNQTDYRLDGGDNNDYESNTSFAFPFPDAVSQFSVETTALGAQSGLHPAGLVNVVTRSGSNQWHGTAFEFIRNNFIDANSFFSATKDSLHQNQFGGTVGGKVIKDKLFFFAGYQRLNFSQSSATNTAFVPTAANLAGDFSYTNSSACVTSIKAGQQIQLFNPITGALLQNDHISPISVANPAGFSPAALALEKYLPATSDPCGKVNYSIPFLQTENQFITRIDSTLSPKHSLYGRYFIDGYNTPAFFSPTNILLTANPGNTERAQTLTIGETWVVSPKLVNTVHVTGTRRSNERGPAAQGINATNLGVDVFQEVPIGLRVQGGKFLTYCSTCATGIFNVNAFSVADDVNMVLGKNQLVFGGEFVRAQLNVNNAFTSNGTFNFTGIFSQKGPGQNLKFTPPAGDSTDVAGTDANLDFLTGAMPSFAQSKPQQNALRAPIPSLYIQDTYHATPKMVISAGLRWGPEYVPTDYFGRGSTFDMASFLANKHSTVFPNAPAGSFFYGDPGVPKNFTQNSLNQFSPRFGITYDPIGDGKTVFRAGSSLVYDETNLFNASEVLANPPFATQVTNSATATGPISFDSPWSGGTSPGNPFPMPFTPPSSTTFSNQSQYIVYPKHFQSPYVLQYTASLQHELPRGWQFQLDYIGNKTTHAAYGYPLNPAVYIPGVSTGAGSCAPLPTAPAPGTACSTTGNQASRFLLTLDNPSQGVKYLGGGAGTVLMVPGATAHYNALVATIQHRASASFVFLANYTWSHCLDIQDNPGAFNSTAVEDPNNIRRDMANCGFDRRHIINSSLVAESHFGLSGWQGYAINHWELAPLLRITSGAPFNVTSGNDNSLTDIGNDRPNLVSVTPYTKTKTQQVEGTNSLFISPAAFTQNAIGTYGNLGRNAFFGPRLFQLDATLSRTFPLHDRLAMVLRLESFNVLNHPNFNNPTSTSLLSSTFGQITQSQGNNTTTGPGAPRIFQGAVKLTF